MIWTDEKTTELTRLYADDYSASLIAEALGDVSRQAVIAKIHRMGLPRRGEGRHPTKELTASGQRTSMPKVFRGAAKRPPREPRPDKQTSRQRHIPGTNRFYEAVSNPAEIKLRCVKIVPRNVTLMDLEPGDCRYPYGDDVITFCGHPKQDGSQYCTPHHHLCWVKPIASLAKSRVYHGTDFARGAA